MSWPSIIFLLLAVTLVVAVEILRRTRMRPFIARSCGGRNWRRRFPDASSAEIREFSFLFIDAFGIKRKHSLKFRPDDRIMDVYRGLNPPELVVADAMELEALALDLEKRYGVRLNDIWHDDITLGQVFKEASSK